MSHGASLRALYNSYRPGVMARLGFGWEELHAAHPHLVMCSISGFGQTGPHAMRPAMDTVAQALSGCAATISGIWAPAFFSRYQRYI